MCENSEEIIDLLKKIKQDDVKSFSIIYDTYYSILKKYVTRIVKGKEQTIDIIQSSFINLWCKRDQIDERKPFEPYLIQIAINLSIDALRKIASDQRLQEKLWIENMGYQISIEEDYVLKEKKYLVNQLIKQLPAQQAEVFRLVKMEGYSYQEVADILNLSKSTISNHLVAAMKGMKQLLQNDKRFMIFIMFVISTL